MRNESSSYLASVAYACALLADSEPNLTDSPQLLESHETKIFFSVYPGSRTEILLLTIFITRLIGLLSRKDKITL